MRNLLLFVVLSAICPAAQAAPTLQSNVALAPAGASHKVLASRFLLPNANTNKAMKQCSKGGVEAVLDDGRFAAVQIDWTAITFDGKQLVELNSGWLGKDDRANATLISLQHPLQSALDGQIQLAQAGCAVGEPTGLLILAGRNVPAETLTAVLTTAGKAGYRTFAVAVDNSTVNATQWTPPSADGWEAWPREQVPSDPIPNGMTWLKIQRTGLILIAKHPSLPRSMVDSPLGCATGSCRQAHEFDWGALDLALAPLLETKANDGVIGVLAQRGASVEVVVQGLRSVIDFPRIVLTGGDADGTPSRRSSTVVQDTQEHSWSPADEVSVIVTSLPHDLQPDDSIEYPRIGYLSKSLFASRMSEYTADARICYVVGLDNDPTVQGDMGLAFTVTGDGTLTDIEIEVNTLDHDNATDCMLEMLRRVKFPPPQDSGPIRGQYTYSFTTDPIAPSLTSPDIGTRILIRTMPKEPMAALIDSKRDAILACVSEQVEGTLGMDVAVNQYGNVSDAVITASPLTSPDMESCVTRSLVGTSYTGDASLVYHLGLSWPTLEPSAAPVPTEPPSEAADNGKAQ